MADRRALGLIGYMLGAVTAAVVLIGLAVVNNEIAGQASAIGLRVVALPALAR